MRTSWVCFIVVVIGGLVGCTGSDDSPTAPGVLDVSGVWTGDATLESATGAGCAGTTLGALVGLSYPITIELDQSAMLVSGFQVSGLPVDGADGSSCELNGSVTDVGFTLASTTCDVEPLEDLSCLDGSLRDLTLVSVSVTATVSGDAADGSTTSEWETADSATGASTGTLVVRADFSLTR